MSTKIGSIPTATSPTAATVSTEADVFARISSTDPTVNSTRAVRSTVGTRRSGSASPGSESATTGQPGAPLARCRFFAARSRSKWTRRPRADVQDHHRAGGWATMFTESPYTAPIPGMTGLVSTKPISIGEGIALPVGTKISDEYGINGIGAPQNQPGRQPGVEFRLPNGNSLKLTPDIDKQSGMHMTRITFDDGRFFRVIGSPFFNPKTGTLTKVQEARDTGSGRQYILRENLLDGSLGMPVRNDAISGKDAETALRAAMR